MTFSVPAGTYTVTVTGPDGSGFAEHTSTVVHTCPGSQTTSIQLSADTDHVCTACCNFPIAKTLNATYAGDTPTLTYDPASSGGGVDMWRGSGTQTVGDVSDTNISTLPASFTCQHQGTTLNVTYEFTCSSGWSFTIRWREVNCKEPGDASAHRTYSNGGMAASESFTVHATGIDLFPDLPCSPFSQQIVLPTTGTRDAGGFPGLTTPGGGGAGNPVTVTD